MKITTDELLIGIIQLGEGTIDTKNYLPSWIFPMVSFTSSGKS